MQGSQGIQITLNGSVHRCDADDTLTILDLIHQHNLNPDNIIVEHNRNLYKKESLGGLKIQNGDKVEFLHFMGGG